MHVVENPTPEFERQFVLAINARRKLKGNKPKFIITSSQVSSSNEDQDKVQVILTVKSIQTLLLSCIDKSPRAYSASWCKILRVQKLQQILVLVLNGVTDREYKDQNQFQAWKQLFTSENVCHEFRFHTQANSSFLEQFSTIAAKNKSEKGSSSTLKTKAEELSKKRSSSSIVDNDSPLQPFKKLCADAFSRVDLVLSLKQLLIGNYPCPNLNPFENFKPLKSSYKPVTATSAILALDVETFYDMVKNRQVPYWISLVDEQLTCIYQTLICPPENEYAEAYAQRRLQVTRIVPSISERSLAQVHQDLATLFADDTILAGHSVENDLKYLQLYHPYIIDTSVVFNVSGSRLEKASLQKLYAIYFGRLIQKTRFEHDPTEDARATMELIHLKLSKNIEFGDWFLGGVDQSQVLGNYDSIKLDENVEECHTFLAQTKFGLREDFFSQIKQREKALIIEQNSNSTTTSLPTVHVDSNRRAFKTCIEQLPSHEFVWLQCHLSFNNDDDDDDDDDRSLVKVTKYAKKLYECLREDSILIGILCDQTDFARCFVRIKDDEKLIPLILNGKEYPYDLKLIKTK